MLAYTAYNTTPYSIGDLQNPQGPAGQTYQPYPPSQTVSATAITLDQAKTIAQQYVQSLGNPNLAIREIMEFQYNFYVQYYEKDTGIGAFEMLIWKQAPPYGVMGSGMGMMYGYGRVVTGVMMPEPGPNMMWNTKYRVVNSGMMGWDDQGVSTMPITKDKALQVAQAYLDENFNGAKVEADASQFYGYYTMDFTISGRVAGMLSVNGFTGQVWFHTWHGAFIQEIKMD